MLNIERELRGQPLIWRQAGPVAAGAVDELPAPNHGVAVIGCGTSYFVGQAMAALREAAGRGEIDAALALWRAHLGEPIEPLADAAEEALEAPIRPDLAEFDRYVFLGTGWG